MFLHRKNKTSPGHKTHIVQLAFLWDRVYSLKQPCPCQAWGQTRLSRGAFAPRVLPGKATAAGKIQGAACLACRFPFYCISLGPAYCRDADPRPQSPPRGCVFWFSGNGARHRSTCPACTGGWSPLKSFIHSHPHSHSGFSGSSGWVAPSPLPDPRGALSGPRPGFMVCVGR